MPETRASLVDAWREFRDGKGLEHTNDNEEFQTCESPALTFLERLIQGLRMTVSEAISSGAAWTLSRLEAMLRDTPGLAHGRQTAPANEIKLQEIMHDYLSAAFPTSGLTLPLVERSKTSSRIAGSRASARQSSSKSSTPKSK